MFVMMYFFKRIIAQLASFLYTRNANVLIIFAASLFVLLMVVGASIDISRYLVARTQVQAALDSALTSTAWVKDTQDIHSVANRFFNANFPNSYGNAGNVTVTLSGNGQTLTGSVTLLVDAIFGEFVGIDQYRFDALSEVSIQTGMTTEIVLALDNSPSMCMSSAFGAPPVPDPSCNKLNALKSAASGFVNLVQSTIAANPGSNPIYFGVVPFNHHVRMPPFIDTLGHPDLVSANVQISGGLTPYLQEILVLTDNIPSVHATISAMSAPTGTWGFTRTNVGTLAAALMMMPYTQDRQYFNHAPSLPNPINPSATQKILVLMTDGENITSFSGGTNTPIINAADNANQIALCEDLRNNYGIIIYTITFDLPNNAVKQIFRDCATNPSFYFDANSNAALTLAFQAIANSINQVRITR